MPVEKTPREDQTTTVILPLDAEGLFERVARPMHDNLLFDKVVSGWVVVWLLDLHWVFMA